MSELTVIKKSFWIMFVLILIGLLIWGFRPKTMDAVQSSVISLPIASADFKRAEGERAFQFPADHGAHPEYQTEWWYYTGNLQTVDGRHFGYQLTFFRRALPIEASSKQRTSVWASEQVYLAHFTLTDVQSGSFQYFERFSRGAVGLAGAVGDPLFQVWLENWSVTQLDATQFRLTAQQDQVQLDLVLNDLKGPVLQGLNGYSQKGPDPGNASYYYSQTRLQSSGNVSLGGSVFQVNGWSWMDHEFSTTALAPDQVGWDWFSIQLDDDRELMMYTIRKQDGSVDKFSSGMLINPDGSTRRLAYTDFKIDVLENWRSPHSGGNYPSRWRISIPDEKLVLDINPVLPDQELWVSFIYWEGAVKVSGTGDGTPVEGRGYVEMTGYAQSMRGQF